MANTVQEVRQGFQVLRSPQYASDLKTASTGLDANGVGALADAKWTDMLGIHFENQDAMAAENFNFQKNMAWGSFGAQLGQMACQLTLGILSWQNQKEMIQIEKNREEHTYDVQTQLVTTQGKLASEEIQARKDIAFYEQKTERIKARLEADATVQVNRDRQLTKMLAPRERYYGLPTYTL